MAFATGALCGGALPAVPAEFTVALTALAAAVLVADRAYHVVAALLAGLTACWLDAAAGLHGQLPAHLDGSERWVEGVVASLPERRPAAAGGGTRFVLALDAGPVARMRASWYGVDGVPAGGRCRLLVRLRAPDGLVSPGGTEPAARLLRQGIGALATVRTHPRNACVAAAAAPVQRLRNHLRAAQRRAGLVRQAEITALTLGDGSDIDDAVWALLRDTGTTHLIVISGQHVAALALVAFVLARLVARAVPPLAARCGSRQPAAVVAMAVATGYALLAGGGIPVQRALVMTLVALLAVLLSRRLRAADVLAVAFGLVLALDPLAWLDAGFWLSFAACGLLLWVARPRREGIARHVPAPLLAWWRVQWAVTVGITPVLLAHFGTAPGVQLVANLLAVPLVGFVVVPCALLGTALVSPAPALAEVPLRAADLVLFGLLDWLRQLAAWGRAWQVVAPSSAWPAWLAALALLLPGGFPGRWLAAPLLVGMLAGEPAHNGIAIGTVRVTVLDVGQGSAVLVQTRSANWLVDAGPGVVGGFDAGESVVVPALRALGVHRLDGVLVSHLDQDHAGGVGAVLAQLPVGRLLAPDPLPGDAATRPCRAGDGFRTDGVAFTIISPRPPLPRSDNDRSCVLLLRTGAGVRVLLPGDLQRAGEHRLVAGTPTALRGLDLLVAPHHGSRSSSSPAFVAATLPKVVVVSAGAGNAFGHPHRDVVARYQAAGAAVFVTAHAGAITWWEDGSISAMRCARPRLWRPAPATCISAPVR
jgi:competence protein ComEC